MSLQTLKWIQTMTIYTILLLLSSSLRATFSTLLDFTEILKTSIQKVSSSLTVFSIAGCVGSFVGAILFNRYDRLTVMAVFIILAGIATAVMPSVASLMLFYFSKAVIGITAGIVRTGIVVTLTEIWEPNSRPFIQAFSFTQMISAFITPLYIHPFLSTETNSRNEKDKIEDLIKNDNLTVHVNVTNRLESKIWIPYLFLGSVIIVTGLFTLFLQLWTAKYSRNWIIDHSHCEIKDNLNKKCESTKKYYWCNAVICLLLIFLVSAKENSFLLFWTTFVVYSDIKFKKAKGSLMLSAFALAVGFATFVNIFVSLKMKSLKTLLILVLFMLIGNLIILFLGNSSEACVWIGGVMISIGIGPSVSTIINLIHERIQMSNLIASLSTTCVYLAHACGLSVIVGHYIEQSPYFLIFMNLVILVTILLLITFLKFI